MKYAQLPCETKSRPLPFYLAMEEYLAGLPCMASGCIAGKAAADVYMPTATT